MGQEMTRLLQQKGIEFFGMDQNDKVPKNFCPDVVLDFSSHLATGQNLDIAQKYNVPIVIATTNHTKQDKKQISNFSKSLPVFMSSNFSVLFNLMLKISKILGGNFEYVLTESHHKTKKDMPSGSAKMLIKNLKKNNIKPKVVCHRVSNIVGEHELKIFAPNECLSICHTAFSRQVFCEGALLACFYIVKKQSGFFGMEDLFFESM